MNCNLMKIQNKMYIEIKMNKLRMQPCCKNTEFPTALGLISELLIEKLREKPGNWTSFRTWYQT